MEASKNIEANSQKRNFSKYDVSGTDPNRYASVSNKKEADIYLHKGEKSIIPGLRINVSKSERLLMIAAGTYLLYRALKKNDSKKVMEGITAGTMLLRGITGYCPAYDLMDNTKVLKGKNIAITTSLTVDKPVSEVYNAWRQLENLPLFMKHLNKVNVINDTTSEWKAKIPGRMGTVNWKAEILMDEPNQLLSWHSLPNSTINNAGKVRFNSNGTTTEIEVTISYHAPLGKAGELTAKLFTPMFKNMLKKDIEGFKEYIEAVPLAS